MMFTLIPIQWPLMAIEGDKMSDKRTTFRMSKRQLEMIQEIQEEYGIHTSEIIRMAIVLVYKELMRDRIYQRGDRGDDST